MSIVPSPAPVQPPQPAPPEPLTLHRAPVILSDSGTGTSSIYGWNDVPVQMYVQSGVINTEVQYGIPVAQGALQFSVAADPRAKGKIALSLYFRFVRSKMTKLQKEKLQKLVARYSSLRFEAGELGQRGLYEHVTENLLHASMELRLLACGLDTVVTKADVEKHMHRATGKLELKPLRQFPRIVPPQVARKLKGVQARKLFDDYCVLYHPAAEEQALKPNAEKVKEKDPILFGTLNCAPGQLYYIADWIDEHCDLTLDKLVDGLRTFDKDYQPRKITAPTDKDIEKMRVEVSSRAQRLRDTNAGNFRSLTAEARAAETSEAPKSRWQRFRAWWNSL